MTGRITASEAAFVFRAALTEHGEQSSLGCDIRVSTDGCVYTVTIPADDRAYIGSRTGRRGPELLDARATAAQDRALRAAHSNA